MSGCFIDDVPQTRTDPQNTDQIPVVAGFYKPALKDCWRPLRPLICVMGWRMNSTPTPRTFHMSFHTF